MRAVSATTSALNGGPDGGMISDDTRGAIQPIISTGMALPRLKADCPLHPGEGRDPSFTGSKA
jgi:hypothetical protein